MSCLPSCSRPVEPSCVQNQNTHHQARAGLRTGRSSLRSPLRQGSARVLWCLFIALLAVFGTSTGFSQAPALTFSAPQPVGTMSSSVTVSVMAQTAGTVAYVEILTGGAPGLDFAAGADASSCSAGLSLAQGQACTQSVTFTPAYPGLRLGAVVLLDSNRTVLGKVFLSGIGKGGLAVLVPGNMVPAAGSGAWNELEDGGDAVSADLNLPASVVLDGAGNMYIADSVHHRIRMVSSGNGATIYGSVTYPAAGKITTIAGNGTADKGADGVAAYNSALNTPSGLALDGAGNLYIADTGNDRVRVINAATGIITTVAGNGLPGDSNGGNVGDLGPATAANLNQPWGVTIDAFGNLYIADTINHRIRKVDAATGIISTVAGTGFTNPNGSGAFFGDGGAATAAKLNRPYAVAFDAAGNMYIPDSGNNRIRLVNLSGTISTFSGTGSTGYAGDGAAAINAKLWAPSGVIVDAAQNVYISDTANNAIRKVNAASGNISTIVQTAKGRSVFGGTLYTNSLYGPMGLALDGNGNLYVADYFFMRIRKIESGVSLLDFTGAAVRAGELSTTANNKLQVVENDGNAPLTLSAISPESNSAVYASSTTCTTGNSLAVDSSCLVGVEFAPTKSGNPLFGEIDVANQTTNSPLDIMLVGNATPVNSTTTTLVSAPNPSHYGQSVTFTATITTGAGTGALTGTITFTDGTTTLQSGIKIAATASANTYVATYSTPGLAVGTHSVTASYSGDAYHLASDPDTLPVVTQVVNELTTTSLSSSANPSSLGASVTFTAKVAISGGGSVVPDGLVNFFDGTDVIGSVAIDASGMANFSTASLSSGTHSITATYNGNTAKNVVGSTSAALSQDVQASSTTVVTATPNPSTYGTSVTFTATVTSASGFAATGVLNFLDGSTQIGSVTLSGTTGAGTFTTSSLTAGSHAITASYQGDKNAGSGVSAPIIQVVNLTATVTSLMASPNPGIAGKPVRLTALVKPVSGSATITGTVTFSDGATAIGSAKVDAAGTAAVSPVLAPGPHAIVATYSGDTNDEGSASTALPLAVNLATTSIAITSNASPAVVLSAITLTATVTGNGGTPTGIVTFYADGASVGTANVGANGTAAFSDSALAVGSHNITASYSGDTNDTPSSSTVLTEVVQAIPTVTSLGSTSSSGTTPQLILVAAITGSTGPTPTGTVTFSDGTKVLGEATLDTSGVATLMPDLAPAVYNIVASYSGDVVHAPSTSSTVKITGTPTGFGITVNPSALTMASTENSTVTVTVSSSNGYSDTIGFGCGTLPAGVTCHFGSDKIALKAGGTANVQLTIDTNTPLNGGSTVMNTGAGGNGFSLAGLFFPAGLMFGWIGWRFRKKNSVVFGAVLAVLFSGMMMMTGCGGFSQKSATPGTYSIQITGIGSSSNISHYQTVTLTITK